MKLESINCNHCGAPLEVADTANFATCHHCDAQLAINRTATASFTEVIDKLADSTERLNDHLARIAYQNELERLDEEWKQIKKQHGVTGKGLTGSSRFASALGLSVALGGVGLTCIVAGICCLFLSESISGFWGFLPIALGIGGIIGAIYGGKSAEKQRIEFLAERKLYEFRRKRLSPADFQGRSRAQEEAGAKE